VPVGLENEPDKLLSMYEIKCKSLLEAIRRRLLKRVTESEGMHACQRIIGGEEDGL